MRHQSCFCLPHVKSAPIFSTDSAFCSFTRGGKAGMLLLNIRTILCSAKSLNRCKGRFYVRQCAVTQEADCQQKKVGFTRNRTRSTIKSNSYPSPETHTKATGNDARDLPCAEKKVEKSDQHVRCLVKYCATALKLIYAFISLATVSIQSGQVH
jgi:hypothetical protein